MIKKTMHIGLDDTDSTRRGCTTYVAALLVEKLEELGAEFIDYPSLIRLNPNVPWKTRGNGALCLRVRYRASLESGIEEAVISAVERHADMEFEGTDPGIVFFKRSQIPKQIRKFSKDAITSVVSLKDAVHLLARFKAESVGFKNGRGIIGALAAVGEILQGDHTYEILAYRVPQNCGLKRKVDEASIFRMDEATAPYTFNNIDADKRRVIITPRGPDPILFGIRGESPEVVKRAFGMVKPLEPVERWVIFRSNQGTDAHLKRVMKLGQIMPYSPVVVRGVVSSNPRIVPRRHVIFSISDDSAQVDCAAYEPTGVLRQAARELIVGDHVEVCGGVRPASSNRPLTINLEKIRVLRLAPKNIYHNPLCSKCGKRLKSMGKNQGFRCEKCGSKYQNLEKMVIPVERNIRRGLYITATRSQRHLTKPFSRYGLEKRRGTIKELIDGWHFP